MSALRVGFAALNAKYAHTNPAIRLVALSAQCQNIPVELWEHNINERYRTLLQSLSEMQLDAVVFSLYLWNVRLACRLAEDLRKIAPETVLVAAGPEVTANFLGTHPVFDYAVIGEGELATPALLHELTGMSTAQRRAGIRPLAAVADRTTPKGYPLAAPRVDMDLLPFAYDDLAQLQGRTLYYESMRGCPFQCSYCLSAADTAPVRMRSLSLVYADLRRFLAAGIHRVKFVDRTFNCDPTRAIALWRWLRENDNGVTSFHFEVAGHLLDDAAVQTLGSLRPGLVQLEVGVQSCNPDTLAAIRRPQMLDRLFARCAEVLQPGNVHLHMDLIAGLPMEDYASFARSFNRVYGLRPHQLQLGFLKVLPGSVMQKEAPGHNILFSDTPPYEVLRTRWLSFAELCRLHGIDDMVDLYNNSGRFSRLIADMLLDFATPFAFFEALADTWAELGYAAAPPSKLGQYAFLGEFLHRRGLPAGEHRQWLCRYDMACHEKPKVSPTWVTVDGFTPHRPRILALLNEQTIAKHLPQHMGQDPKAIVRMVHIEVFPFDPRTGGDGETVLLFDYSRRDVDGRAKTTVLCGANS